MKEWEGHFRQAKCEPYNQALRRWTDYEMIKNTLLSETDMGLILIFS